MTRVAATVCGVLLWPLPLAAQAPPIFGAQVETVYVDAFVTRGGRPVPDLRGSDFELKDNGVVQRVELIATGSQPLLAVLAFDTSASMAGEKLEALRMAAAGFLEGLRQEDEVALLAFSEEIAWSAWPTRDRSAIRLALERLRAGGLTAALDALYAALLLPAAPGRNLLVLFSDGEDNMSWLDADQVRGVAQRSNALIQVVGLRPPREEPVAFSGPRWMNPTPMEPAPTAPEPGSTHSLREIAELTGGRFWSADSPARLKDAFAAIIEAMKTRYVLRYEPQDAKLGWHRIELRLRGQKGDVHARRGYFVGRR